MLTYEIQSLLLSYVTVLAGMSRHLHDWLQLVLNAAARVVFSARRSDHIIPIAPGPSLVARPGACQLQVICVGLPVSAQHGTVVPRRRTAADFYCWYPPSTPLC